MRYFLSACLLPFVVLSMAVLGLAYLNARLVYWLACKADGRPLKSFPTFDQYIRNFP